MSILKIQSYWASEVRGEGAGLGGDSRVGKYGSGARRLSLTASALLWAGGGGGGIDAVPLLFLVVLLAKRRE